MLVLNKSEKKLINLKESFIWEFKIGYNIESFLFI
jgi:hypothetical protein